jgi:Protein of unknown function (DUF1566)
MPQRAPKGGTVLMAAVIAVWVGGWRSPAVAEQARVPRTGQTTSFAAGDDGALQAGILFPTPRFLDHGDGTVEDQLTGLIWLKNVKCTEPGLGFVACTQALTAVNTMAHGHGGLTDHSQTGAWRLPNVNELHSLIDRGFVNPALANTAGTAQWTEGDAFSGVQSAGYWSSTTFTGHPDHAWVVYLGGGGVSSDSKNISNWVWPVRGADSGMAAGCP